MKIKIGKRYVTRNGMVTDTIRLNYDGDLHPYLCKSSGSFWAGFNWNDDGECSWLGEDFNLVSEYSDAHSDFDSDRPADNHTICRYESLSRRDQFAMAVMQKLCITDLKGEGLAKISVWCADALIAELDKHKRDK